VVSLLDGSREPLVGDFTGRGARAGKISRSLVRSLVAETVPDVAAYGDWFMLANVRHYFKTLAIVARERGFLRECYWLCADLEADAALARHLRLVQSWCWAARADAGKVELEQGVHPLLDGGSPLSLALDGKGAFLSGQNGVGKSTFLRMLGLNLAAARAFGFCYARTASLPALPVVASMQNEDSLLDGHSLYIAELARARELLAAGAGRPVICLVDEIFRGTNHEESVAAAAAVLDALAARSLVVVSSHNLVLGPLLAHRLDPWRIVREEGGGLRMEPGVLGRTNGVALLAQRGFDAGIQRKAERVAAWLARQRHGEVDPVLLDE
jgi:DNA mismatch repair ATPase MutS